MPQRVFKGQSARRSRRLQKSGKSSSASRAVRSAAQSALVEGLECRQLLSGSWVSGGVLYLQGTSSGYNNLTVDHLRDGTLVANADGSGTYVNPRSIHQINITGGNGSDHIWINETSVPVSIQSYNGDDSITAAGSGDTIVAGDGNDNIQGGSGNETIIAGNGNNYIYSGKGASTSITAGNGANHIWGQGGNDTITAGSGANTIHAGTGNDVIRVGGGEDLIYGEGGNDTIWGGAGNDTIFGGGGNDVVHRGSGNTTFPDFTYNDMSEVGTVASPLPQAAADEISPELTHGGMIPNNDYSVTGTNNGDSTAPTPAITVRGREGYGPHTVFVHALDSVLGSGTVLTTRYQWNFGDATGRFNTLEGWNAAHTYDKPGVYTITLTLTNQLGKTRTLTTTAIVLADTRPTIFVDNNGSDQNNGLSPQSAVRTIDRAAQLMTSGMRILFHAGQTFNVANGFSIVGHDILLGSYGSGPNATLMRVPAANSGTSTIGMYSSTSQVVIQDLNFDSPWKPVGVIAEKMPADGIFPAGENITIRRCTFLNLDTGVNEDRSPNGILIQDCSAPLATGLRGVFIWGQGTDNVILGNYAANSTREHIVRTVGTVRELIAYNNFTNLDRRNLGDALDYNKGTIDVHKSEYAYVADNWVYDGELRVGPRIGPTAAPGDISDWTVLDGNHVFNHSVQVYPGTYHLMMRNNVISNPFGESINIIPENGAGDNIRDITIVNNTAINSGVGGQFIYVDPGGSPGRLTLANNLWIAPYVTPGTHGTAAVFINDKNSSILKLSEHNVWQMPSQFNAYANGGINYVNTSWAPPTGYYTPRAWNALPNVSNDLFSATPVNGALAPTSASVAAGGALPFPGVFTDIYGNARSGGRWTAGAVNTGASGPLYGAPAAPGSAAAVYGVQAAAFNTTPLGRAHGIVPPVIPPIPPVVPPVVIPVTPSTSAPSAKTWLAATHYAGVLGLAPDNIRGLGYAVTGDYAAYRLDFGLGVRTFCAGVSALYAGGSIEIHVNSPTGPLAGTLKVVVTGAWNNYTTQSTAVSGLTGVQTVYLVFKGPTPGIANISCLAFA